MVNRVNDSFFNLPGYELITRRDRKDTTGGIGGGLVIYAKNDIVGNVSEVCREEFDQFTEISAIRIGLAGEPEMTLALMYRPHYIYENKVAQTDKTSENNALLCNLLKQIPKPYVIVGDLNYSNIDWHTLSANSSSENFLKSVKDNFVSQHIDFPTHNSGTQPDVVLSSNDDIVMDVEGMCHLGSSDHSMLMVTMKGSVSRNVTFEEVPDWRNADLAMLRDELRGVCWKMDGLDTLKSWSFIKEKIWEAEDKSVPKKRRRVGCRPLWMQQNVMRVIRKKETLGNICTRRHEIMRSILRIRKWRKKPRI